MHRYQEQNSNLTLREGLEDYYNSFPSSKDIFKDDNNSGTLLRDHDCTHVIFGLDISIDQEAILDVWTLFGSSYKWSYILKYRDLPQLKGLYNSLWKEFGLHGFIKIYLKLSPILVKAFFRTRKMKKKWPFMVPEHLFDKKISDLRKEYGITVLTLQDLSYEATVWSGEINK